MKENKTKDFQDFIKQDFDIVNDYKNASKEITPLEDLDKAISILQTIFEECGDKRIDNVLDLLVYPFAIVLHRHKQTEMLVVVLEKWKKLENYAPEDEFVKDINTILEGGKV